ncbi:MAG: hypothetical protein WCL71_14080, partial [Deltaproteobacteria bacterium]
FDYAIPNKNYPDGIIVLVSSELEIPDFQPDNVVLEVADFGANISIFGTQLSLPASALEHLVQADGTSAGILLPGIVQKSPRINLFSRHSRGRLLSVPGRVVGLPGVFVLRAGLRRIIRRDKLSVHLSAQYRIMQVALQAVILLKGGQLTRELQQQR